MFRVISLNVNGIRSAANKGLATWVEQMAPDFMGLQELKAQHPDIVKYQFEHFADLRGYFHFAEKKGYSGVAAYCAKHHKPSDVIVGICPRNTPKNDPRHIFDAEGRWIELRFDRPGRKLSLISCYFPSGSSSPERQEVKFRFLKTMTPHLKTLQTEREFILIGDINIAHQEIDLKNWKGNLKNSGFLPEERAWMTHTLEDIGLIDVYRHLEPNTTDTCYTWWSQRGQARTNNVGWRIDYQLATPALAAMATKVQIYKKNSFSDHAPLIIDYNLTL
jgi:exodeoxyribonuclease-3